MQKLLVLTHLVSQSSQTRNREIVSVAIVVCLVLVGFFRFFRVWFRSVWLTNRIRYAINVLPNAPKEFQVCAVSVWRSVADVVLVLLPCSMRVTYKCRI